MNEFVYNSNRESAGVIEKMRRALFGSLYKLKQSIVAGQRFFYWTSLVSMLQLLYLPFSSEGNFYWPDRFEDSIQPVLRWISFGFLANRDPIAKVVLFGVAFTVTAFLVIGMCLLGMDELSRNNKHAVMVPALAIVFRLGQTVLLLPVLSAFSSTFHCTDSDLYECQGVVSYVLQATSGICIFLYIAVISICALVVIHYLPFSDKSNSYNLYSAPHGRVEFFSVLLRSACVISVSLGGTFDPSINDTSRVTKSVLTTVIVCTGVALVAVYLYFLPFHNMLWNRCMVGTYSVFLWGGVGLSIAQAVDNQADQSSFFVFCVTLPFFVFTCIAMVDYRINSIRLTANDMLLQSPILAELRLRLKYAKELASEDFEFQGEVEEGYKKALEMYRDSGFLCLYVASLAVSAGSRVIFALNLIRRAKHLSLPLDLEFFLFYHNKMNEERESHSSGAISFMDFDRHLKIAREKIMETIKLTSKFWEKVSKGINMTDLIADGCHIHATSLLCRQHLKRLLKLSDSNIEALRWYSIYSYYIMNDKHSAMKLLQRRDSDDEGSGGYAVCTVSGNAGTLGQIMDMTDALGRLFGYSKMELVGRNVKILCPAPFDRMHDLMVRQFVSIDAKFTTKTRRIYGIHRNGYIFPVEFVITPSTNANSDLVLIGKFTQLSQPEDTHLFLVDGSNGAITTFSKDVAETFNIDLTEALTGNLAVTDVFPNFYLPDGTCAYEKEQLIPFRNLMVKVKGNTMRFKAKENSPVVFDYSATLLTVTIVDALTKSENFVSCDVDGGQGIGSDEYPSEHGGSNERIDSVRPPPLNMDRTQGSAGRGINGSPMGRSKPYFMHGSPLNETGSQDGSSIAESQFTTDMQISQIQRRIMASLHKHDPQLTKTASCARRSIILFSALAITSMVMIMGIYNGLVAHVLNMESCHMHSHLLVTLSTYAFYLKDRTMPFPGESSIKWFVPNPEGLVQDSLIELKDLHKDLIARVHSQSVFEDVDKALFSPSILAPGENISRTMSFHVAILEYIKYVEKFVKHDELECIDSCEYIIETGPYKTFDVAREAAFLFKEETEAKATQVASVGWGLILVVVLASTISFFFGYAPMLWSQGHSKAKIGAAFLAIPTSVSKKMKLKSKRRLRMLQQNNTLNVAEECEEEDALSAIGEDFMEDEEDESDSLEVVAIGATTPTVVRRPSAKVAPTAATSPPDTRRKTLPTVDSKGEQTRAKRAWQVLARFCQFLPIGLTFYVVLGFFVGMVRLDQNHLEAIRAKTTTFYLSGERFVLASSVNFAAVQRFQNITQVEQMEALVTQLANVDYSLIYGDETAGVRAFEDSEGELYSLYYDHACDASCDKFLDANQNRTDDVEYLKYGLQLAFEHYIDRLREVVEYQRAYALNPTDKTLTDLLNSQMTFQSVEPHNLLLKQLEKTMEKYFTELSDEIDDVRSQKTVLTCLLVVCLLISHLITMATFSKMDKDLKNTKTLLLMLPLEVFSQVPSMRELLRERDA